MITFVGGGIRGLSQLTLEGLEALQAAEVVLTFQDNPCFFEKYGIGKVESLASAYHDSARDDENYSRIIEKIEEKASKHGRVAVLLPGHPRVGVSVVQKFSHRCDVRVLPGISSLATMINDLGVDPLERGSVILDVNRLLLFNLRIQPEFDHYLYHVCSVGTAATHFTNPSRDNAIHLLGKKLQEAFPDSHEAVLVGSSASEDGSPLMITVKIREIQSILKDIRFDTSLYIPGLKPKTVNREFLARLQDSVRSIAQ